MNTACVNPILPACTGERSTCSTAPRTPSACSEICRLCLCKSTYRVDGSGQNVDRDQGSPEWSCHCHPRLVEIFISYKSVDKAEREKCSQPTSNCHQRPCAPSSPIKNPQIDPSSASTASKNKNWQTTTPPSAASSTPSNDTTPPPPAPIVAAAVAAKDKAISFWKPSSCWKKSKRSSNSTGATCTSTVRVVRKGLKTNWYRSLTPCKK